MRPSLQGLHKRACFLRVIIQASGGKPRPDPLFQIPVEIFIGILFKGIRRKIKHLCLVLVGF